MYYEDSKKNASVMLARRTTGVIALRVIVAREKFERALFKWPYEFWYEPGRMILPRGDKDSEYGTFVKQAQAAMDEAAEILARPNIRSIADFKAAYTKEEAILSEALNAYNKRYSKKNSKKAGSVISTKILSIIGDMPLSEIAERHLLAIDTAMMSNSKTYVISVHCVLKGIIAEAVARGELSRSPYAHFKSSVRTKTKKRVVANGNAVDALFSAWQEMEDCREREAARLFLIQAYTGARYSDAVNITSADLNRGEFVMVKTGQVCGIFVSERLQMLCTATPVGLNYHSYHYEMQKLSERLGHDYSHSHSARRYFATEIYQKTGKDLKVVQRALGHTSIASTEKYVQANTDTLKAAVESLGKM